METHEAKEAGGREGEPPYSNTLHATDTPVNRRLLGPAIGLLLSASLCGLMAVLIAVQMALDWTNDSKLAIARAQDSKVKENGEVRELILPPKGEGQVQPDEPVQPPLFGRAPQILRIPGLEFLNIRINFGGYVCLLIYLLPVTFVLVRGALKMMSLQSYRSSILASVLALLPITPGWCIGLPVGIWALVVLFDPQVRAAFRS